MLTFDKYYRPFDRNCWQGRVDHQSDRDAFRWHQVVEELDLASGSLTPPPVEDRGFCFLGFCCDEGVKRNKGRAGAVKAPASIRKEMSNLPCWFDHRSRLFDAGDILCPGGDLDGAQAALSRAVEQICTLGLFPLLLGGGHEIAFGHFRGLLPEKKRRNPGTASSIGIINFDAHFDLRPYHPGEGSSGTAFSQMAGLCKEKNEPFAYFCTGIQQYGNTRSLFKTAEQLGTQYIMAKNLGPKTLRKSRKQLTRFIRRHQHIYLTICSDVFSSAYAPGVSAPQPFGLHPETVLALVKHIAASGKMMSMDIAEVSPRFDEDNRTAKLAAIVLFAVVNSLVKPRQRRLKEE